MTFDDFCINLAYKGGQKPEGITRQRWNACQAWFLNRMLKDDFVEEEREYLTLHKIHIS